MKKALLLIIPILCTAFSCGTKVTDDNQNGEQPQATHEYVVGADISWLSEMERDSKVFKHTDGTIAKDLFEVLADFKMKAVRLRVWVDPYDGWSGKDDMVSLAKRASAAGLDIMVDFHYSDFFADPSRQIIPAAWKADQSDLQKVCSHVAAHTEEVLKAIKKEDITPKWVQIGNETRNGMIHPTGQLWNSSGNIPNSRANFAALYNAGYNAAKAVFPDVIAMPHLNNAWEDNAWWFREMKQAGAKFDAIALSHYPQVEDGQTWKQVNNKAAANIAALGKEFKLDVYVSEVGVTTTASENEAVMALSDFMGLVKKIDCFAGIFYWEPEVYGNWKPAIYGNADLMYQYTGKRETWGSYGMGAFLDDGRPSAVMTILSR